jgi:hypothetical protein
MQDIENQTGTNACEKEGSLGYKLGDNLGVTYPSFQSYAFILPPISLVADPFHPFLCFKIFHSTLQHEQ